MCHLSVTNLSNSPDKVSYIYICPDRIYALVDSFYQNLEMLEMNRFLGELVPDFEVI